MIKMGMKGIKTRKASLKEEKDKEEVLCKLKKSDFLDFERFL